MLFLQYKSDIKAISFANTFSEFLEACQTLFPQLAKFQLELQLADSKVIIDSEDVYQSIKAANENATSLQTTVFVAVEVIDPLPQEINIVENTSIHLKEDLNAPLLAGRPVATPMSRRDEVLDKLDLYKAIYYDIQVLELKEKIGRKIDNMKPEHKKYLIEARDIGNKIVAKGKELVRALGDKIRTIKTSA